VDTEFIMEGLPNNKLYYLHAILEYRLINQDWKFIEGVQIKYFKNYEDRSFKN